MAENQLEPHPPEVQALPAADITAPPGTAGSVVQQSFPVKRPQQDLDEFVVQVRASTLKRARKQLTRLAKTEIPVKDILLAICSASIGGILGALPASISRASELWTLFFIALPILAVGTGVGFYFKRKETGPVAAELAQEVLDDLPDPDSSH